MNIIVWFEYFVKLENIWVTNFSQQVDFIVETEHRFDVILKHGFADSLKSKLTSFTRMCDLVDFRKIAFSNKVADLILRSQTLKYSEVFEQIEPSSDHVRLLRDQSAVFSRSSWSHNYDLILEPDYNTLIEIQSGSAASELTAKNDGLSGLLNWYEVHLAILDVENLTITIIIIISLKFVKFAFEEDEVVFLWGFDAVFF